MTDISRDETTLLYEALGLFRGGTYDWYDFGRLAGTLDAMPLHEQVDFSTAVARVNGILSAINAADATDGRRARISEILAEYKGISLDAARFGPGGAEGAPGMRYAPDEHRAHLRRLLETHLGVRIGIHPAPDGAGRAVPVER